SPTRCCVKVFAALPVVLAGVLATGCAMTTATSGTTEDAPRRLVVAPDAKTHAYYFYSIAQLMAQGGRFKEAIEPLREAIKRDPDSAVLWTQLAQWLARSDAPDEAVQAARR